MSEKVPTLRPPPLILVLNRPGVDMDMALDKIVPVDLKWLHTDEGPE